MTEPERPAERGIFEIARFYRDAFQCLAGTAPAFAHRIRGEADGGTAGEAVKLGGGSGER